MLVFTLATGRARAQARVETATAELPANKQELRRQQANLTAFAGVVAHDLKAPLAAVLGHAEIMAEALDDGADPATVRPRLDRVLAGGARMTTLIDDLLAYATARDTTLRPADVALRELVDEVVIGHLDAAAAIGSPMPTVFVGDLPDVHGDTVMLRQLLHNLIGNAIKYTPTGQVPRVDVTATTTGRPSGGAADRRPRHRHPTRTAPRDIRQLPPRPHRHHHRRHRSGSGQCYRITERHGGTIAAEDNPGGGTRITVTVPTAAKTPARSAVATVPPCPAAAAL